MLLVVDNFYHIILILDGVLILFHGYFIFRMVSGLQLGNVEKMSQGMNEYKIPHHFPYATTLSVFACQQAAVYTSFYIVRVIMRYLKKYHTGTTPNRTYGHFHSIYYICVICLFGYCLLKRSASYMILNFVDFQGSCQCLIDR